MTSVSNLSDDEIHDGLNGLHSYIHKTLAQDEPPSVARTHLVYHESIPHDEKITSWWIPSDSKLLVQLAHKHGHLDNPNDEKFISLFYRLYMANTNFHHSYPKKSYRDFCGHISNMKDNGDWQYYRNQIQSNKIEEPITIIDNDDNSSSSDDDNESKDKKKYKKIPYKISWSDNDLSLLAYYIRKEQENPENTIQKEMYKRIYKQFINDDQCENKHRTYQAIVTKVYANSVGISPIAPSMKPFKKRIRLVDDIEDNEPQLKKVLLPKQEPLEVVKSVQLVNLESTMKKSYILRYKTQDKQDRNYRIHNSDESLFMTFKRLSVSLDGLLWMEEQIQRIQDGKDTLLQTMLRFFIKGKDITDEDMEVIDISDIPNDSIVHVELSSRCLRLLNALKTKEQKIDSL